jgi:excisionase family DNA binding protein
MHTANESVVDNDPYGKLLTTHELGRILQKSESSIYRLRKRREIPFLLIGGEIRFRLKDVERALENFTVREMQT